MSTNKTPNYNLHSWLGSDDFRFHEINENFTALDAAVKSEENRVTALSALLDQKAQLVSGIYNGTPEDQQTITLGFQPKVVLSVRANGQVTSPTCSTFFCALSIPGCVDSGIQITQTGFIARNYDKSHMTSNNSQFVYLALR